MTEWIACLDETSIKLEINTNAKTPEVMLRTEDAYGSTVTVRMTKEQAAQLAAELMEMSEVKNPLHKFSESIAMLGRAYGAMNKASWEEGETEVEVSEAINDFLSNIEE